MTALISLKFEGFEEFRVQCSALRVEDRRITCHRRRHDSVNQFEGFEGGYKFRKSFTHAGLIIVLTVVSLYV